MNVLAKNLAYLRSHAKLKQFEVANQLSIKRNTWSNWENKVSEPSINDLRNIGRLFSVSIDDLLNIDFELDDYKLPKNGTSTSVEGMVKLNNRRIKEIERGLDIMIDELQVLKDRLRAWAPDKN